MARPLRVAARFNPPSLAIEYRHQQFSHRDVYAMDLYELIRAGTLPSPAIDRLMSAADFPIPPHLISRRQLERLYFCVQERWATLTHEDPSPSASCTQLPPGRVAALQESEEPAALIPTAAPAVAVTSAAPPAAVAVTRSSVAAVAVTSAAPPAVVAVTRSSVAAVAVTSAAPPAAVAVTSACDHPVYRVSRRQRLMAEQRYVSARPSTDDLDMTGPSRPPSRHGRLGSGTGVYEPADDEYYDGLL
jgi:hypothetical protein